MASEYEDRLAMCQKLAAEAEQLAAQCTNPEAQKFYRDLKRQWDELAAELQKAAPGGG